jgi:Transcriptional regulatory protein, C terminal
MRCCSASFAHRSGRSAANPCCRQQTREDVLDRTVDVQILRLRRKLEVDPGTPPVIKTERGVGYVFNLPVEELDHGVPRRVKLDLVDRQT